MPRYQTTLKVDRTPAQVFDVIGTHVFDNHPRWETEVVEIRPVTPGPVRLGSTAVMVREERGKRSEVPYEVIAFEPDQLIGFQHDTPQMGFGLRFELAPASHGGTDLTIDVNMTPHGALRLMTPMFAIGMRPRTKRIGAAMVALVEGRAAQQAVVSAPAEPEEIWSGRRDSNSRPPGWEPGALPTELLPRPPRL